GERSPSGGFAQRAEGERSPSGGFAQRAEGERSPSGGFAQRAEGERSPSGGRSLLPMELGVAVRSMGPQSRPEVLLACVRAAEAAGLADAWIQDHIAIPPDDAEGS